MGKILGTAVIWAVSFLVGVICVLLGRANMRGDLSSIQAYHQSRVSERDSAAFGKQMGLGLILMGIGIMAFSVLGTVTLYTGVERFILAGIALLLVSLIAGLALCVRAMKKFNKGIF